MQTPLATNHMLPTLCNQPYATNLTLCNNHMIPIKFSFYHRYSTFLNFPFDFAQNYATALCYQPYTTTLSIQLMHVTSFMQKSLWNKPHATNLMNRLYYQTLNNINKFLHNHVRH